MKQSMRIACLPVFAVLFLGCESQSVSAGRDAPVADPPRLLTVQAEEATPKQPISTFDDSAPRAAAAAFVASLTDDQRNQTVQPVDDDTRAKWHYVPRNRPGVKLGDMTDNQKHKLHALLQTGLSNAGYLKVTDILWLEMVLAELENNPNYRDIGKYHVLVFGDPSAEGAAWGWRFEGHHISINFLYTDAGIAVTPMFLGTNPAVVPSGPLAGKRILADEHNLALELVQSLSEEQLKKAIIGQKPRDIITGPGREDGLKEAVGLPWADLKGDQTLMLLQLSSAYSFNYANGYYAEIHSRWGEKDESIYDFKNYHFAWAGPTDGSGPFYYRIHSPTFVIEYSMQGKNHVHSVFHDLTDPLGEDLLKKHYELHDHAEQ